MKKTKMQINKKLNLNKNQVIALTTGQANNIAGGAGTTSRLITFNALCDIHSNNTHIESVCACTRP